MAKNHNSTVALMDVKEELKDMIMLTKKFVGYKIKTSFLEDIHEAANMIDDGKKDVAIELINNTTKGIRATLGGFFRNSPRYFVGLSNELQIQFDLGIDKDLQEKLSKFLGDVETYARRPISLDLNFAAELYSKAHEVLKSVGIEQRSRIENRKRGEALKRAEEFKAKEAKRIEDDKKSAMEQQRIAQEARTKEANNLRELVDMMQ